jgi:hypothetical protein
MHTNLATERRCIAGQGDEPCRRVTVVSRIGLSHTTAPEDFGRRDFAICQDPAQRMIRVTYGSRR